MEKILMLLMYLNFATDHRQSTKVRHRIKDAIALVEFISYNRRIQICTR